MDLKGVSIMMGLAHYPLKEHSVSWKHGSYQIHQSKGTEAAVAVRSTAYFCSRLIAGSNPACWVGKGL
jgi:hypothetical protein